MAERGSRRPWIKLHTGGILHGSISYQLSEEEQAVWIKLLCMAGEVNRDGQISDNDGRPFPHAHIVREIGTTIELFEDTLVKCIDEGRITEDNTGLHITNWKIYQSEYQRQLPYRKEKQRKGVDEYLYCIACGYAVPYGQQTKSWVYCPTCEKRGKKSKLERRSKKAEEEK